MTVDLFGNNAATTLTVAVTTTPAAGTAETWAVASTAAPFPQIVSGQMFTATVGPGTDLDREIVDVTAIATGEVLVLRGAEGSTIKTHASGAAFTHVVTAAFLNQIMTAVNQLIGTPPAVTGAKAGNTALAGLITHLAALGLVTDSTT